MYPLNSTRVGGKENFFHCVKCGMLSLTNLDMWFLVECSSILHGGDSMFFHTQQWWLWVEYSYIRNSEIIEVEILSPFCL
jgi:hypothetical protein